MSMFGLIRDFPNCNVSVKVHITSHSLTLASWVTGPKWQYGVLNAFFSTNLEFSNVVIIEWVGTMVLLKWSAKWKVAVNEKGVEAVVLKAKVLNVTGLILLSTPLRLSSDGWLGFQSLHFLVPSLVHEFLLASGRTDAVILIEGVAELLEDSVRPDGWCR